MGEPRVPLSPMADREVTTEELARSLDSFSSNRTMREASYRLLALEREVKLRDDQLAEAQAENERLVEQGAACLLAAEECGDPGLDREHPAWSPAYQAIRAQLAERDARIEELEKSSETDRND